MILYRELQLHTGSKKRSVCIGKADTEEEKRDIYHLRYSVYASRGYIDPSEYENNQERDEYDQSPNTQYFIAKIDEKLIGCIRLILGQPLPTQSYFDFFEPSQIKIIPPQNRCELGRFIIIPPDRDKEDYLPRGLVMLLLLEAVSRFAITNNIFGGFAFIKDSLWKKFKKLGVPIGEIKEFKEHYPPKGALYNYFNQKKDPVIPIYFITKNFLDFSEKIIFKRNLFEVKNDSLLVLKENLYIDFLRLLKII